MPTPTLRPNRSVLLAAWLAGTGSDAQLVAAVQGDDEPHAVSGLDGVDDLAGLAAAWRGAQVTAVLPAPGDVVGVPAEATAAVDVGECVLVHDAAAWAAVPQVVGFGPPGDRGHLVTWQVLPVGEWRTRLPGIVGSLGEAERDLRAAVTTTVDTLAALDVARWRPDVAEALGRLRGPVGMRLPPMADPRAVRVLADATRLRMIVALATTDDGAAVSSYQADRRLGALREVDRAARRAVSAACLVLGRQPRTER